jgi:hypothetical protein
MILAPSTSEKRPHSTHNAPSNPRYNNCMRVKVCTCSDEMDAALTKGYLESAGVHAFSSADTVGPVSLNRLSGMPDDSNSLQSIYVEESDLATAHRLLEERDDAAA